MVPVDANAEHFRSLIQAKFNLEAGLPFALHTKDGGVEVHATLLRVGE
jgi:hypothetical protein